MRFLMSAFCRSWSVVLSWGWPKRMRLWFLGKSSSRSRSLCRASCGKRWASSMIGRMVLPLALRLRASAIRRVSHLWSLPMMSTCMAWQRSRKRLGQV